MNNKAFDKWWNDPLVDHGFASGELGRHHTALTAWLASAPIAAAAEREAILAIIDGHINVRGGVEPRHSEMVRAYILVRDAIRARTNP
ncbi:MAG: hypothetical protein IMZ62_12920 [Chloroflexi bacterium]|nr:hypothetical protein [Chloroflexota bacterium]MBE3119106.1 hypothetical protein [Candidatus Atribacteria bacterium]